MRGARGILSDASLFIARSAPDISFMQQLMEEQKRIGHPLPINVLLVLSLLRQERKLTAEEIEKETPLSGRRLKALIGNLVEQGLIEEIGKGKGRAYILSRRFCQKTRKTADYVRQKGIEEIRFAEMLLKLAETQEYITRADAAELLHISGSAAYQYIRKLKKEGKLIQIHNGRYTKYKITR